MKATPGTADGLRLPVTLLVLWFAGLYLRLPILVAPPLAPLIGAELDLNQAEIGALTTLPVLMLALGALPGSFAISRLGARAAVVLALITLALASAARGLAPPPILLFVSTAIMGLGIAVMQPALPVLVRQWSPAHMALGSAVYMNGLLMGEFVGAGLTLPVLMPWLDDDWRATLCAWSLPALLVAVAVLRHGRRAGSEAAPVQASWNPPWREARVWRLGLLLAAASAGFFGTNAYMGSVLQERGRADELAGVLLAFNATQVVGSLLMIALARVLVGRRWPVIVAAFGLPLGLLGFAFGGAGLFLGAVLLLGLCTCVQLILMVSLVPLAGGVLADFTGVARMALAPLGLLSLVSLAVALAPGFGHGAGSTSTGPAR